MVTPNESDTLVGLTEEAAIDKIVAARLQYRIQSRDGKPLVHTQDYNAARLKLVVVNGIVTEVRKG